MHDVQLSTLALRLNQPYWMLHAGNCEHTLVIDEIRYVVTFSSSYMSSECGHSLKHPLDPTDGYPLTTYLQPTMIDMCRGCSKVPAVWSISGDIRLGESPCLLCAPCWRRMGMPQNTEPGDIVVARLPRYDIGW
jgi:snRNA-activating protein complex subunit 3